MRSVGWNFRWSLSCSVSVVQWLRLWKMIQVLFWRYFFSFENFEEVVVKKLDTMVDSVCDGWLKVGGFLRRFSFFVADSWETFVAVEIVGDADISLNCILWWDVELDGCRGGFFLEDYIVRYEDRVNIMAVGSNNFFLFESRGRWCCLWFDQCRFWLDRF